MHRALSRFEVLANKASKNNSSTCWILKCDIRKFFASVDHGIMIDILRSRIIDPRLLDLLKCIIRSFETQPGKGVPLGNVTSQLFANVYMNEFDQFVKHELRMKYYARYADDFVFMSRDRSELLNRLPEIAAFLSGPLALSLHPDKVFIKTFASGVDFLGWVHFPRHRVPRTKTKIRMNARVCQTPSRQSVQSYLGFLSHGSAYELSRKLENLWWLLTTK